MKTYSNKSNARRAAKAAGLDLETITFVQNAEGWYWEAVEAPTVQVKLEGTEGLEPGLHTASVQNVHIVGGKVVMTAKVDQAVAEAIAELDTSAEDAALAQLEVEAESLASLYGSATCPHCGIGLDNGVLRHGDEVNGKIIKLTQEFQCMACGDSFGEFIEEQVVATSKQAAPKQSKGLKIERNRDEQNGVKRPSVGSTCRQLWDMFDAMYAEKGIVPTPAPAKAKSAEQGLSPVTTTVQLYQWRAFMGFKGR